MENDDLDKLRQLVDMQNRGTIDMSTVKQYMEDAGITTTWDEDEEDKSTIDVINEKAAELPIWAPWIEEYPNHELMLAEETFNGAIFSISQSEVKDRPEEALALASWILEQLT